MNRRETLCFGVVSLLLLNLRAYAGPVTVEKATVFLEKRKPCLLAVGDVAKTTDGLATGCSSDCLLGAIVWCIQDVTLGKGTVNETSGCSLASYDLETNSYGRVVGQYLVASGHSCADGGFESLLKIGFSGGTVENFLTIRHAPLHFVLFPSTDSKIVDWWKKQDDKVKLGMEEGSKRAKAASMRSAKKANDQKLLTKRNEKLVQAERDANRRSCPTGMTFFSGGGYGPEGEVGATIEYCGKSGKDSRPFYDGKYTIWSQEFVKLREGFYTQNLEVGTWRNPRFLTSVRQVGVIINFTKKYIGRKSILDDRAGGATD
ncbi:hypothetical protein WDW37_08155 [Bdellovibrionota bacterium FG-1]